MSRGYTMEKDDYLKRLRRIEGQVRGIQRMVDDGIIDRTDAASHPLRNRVFSCLGGDELPHVEVSPAVALADGDLIALCTDGAWAPLGESLVSELRRAPPGAGVPAVLDAAQNAAGPRA